MNRKRIVSTLACAMFAAGLAPSTAAVPGDVRQRPAPARVAAPVAAAAPQHRFFGSLVAVNGTSVVLRLRSGRELQVDASAAFALERVAQPLFRGKPTVVEGVLTGDGVLHASAVRRAAPNVAAWGADI